MVCVLQLVRHQLLGGLQGSSIARAFLLFQGALTGVQNLLTGDGNEAQVGLVADDVLGQLWNTMKTSKFIHDWIEESVSAPTPVAIIALTAPPAGSRISCTLCQDGFYSKHPSTRGRGAEHCRETTLNADKRSLNLSVLLQSVLQFLSVRFAFPQTFQLLLTLLKPGAQIAVLLEKFCQLVLQRLRLPQLLLEAKYRKVNSTSLTSIAMGGNI